MSSGAMNWPFLMFTGRPVAAQATIRSVWRQRKAGTWRQSTTSEAGLAWPGSWTSVSSGQARLGLHARQDAEPLVEARAPVGAQARAVRLVHGRLEDEREVVARGQELERARGGQRRGLGLDHVEAGDEDERRPAPQGDVADLEHHAGAR